MKKALQFAIKSLGKKKIQFMTQGQDANGNLHYTHHVKFQHIRLQEIQVSTVKMSEESGTAVLESGQND